MNQFESKLKDYINFNCLDAEHLVFKESCHSVEEAAKASNSSPDDFVKNICLIDENNNLIIAIVKGTDRVSTTKIGNILNIAQPRTATPEEILEKTGYPCGGVPSFGYSAQFLIDPKVMEMDVVYTGGGSPNSLVIISSVTLQKANKGVVLKIRK
ncbi:YbaK/EbsC family protein [Dehalobacter sp. DCM]|uniref:YbaK/EbsC family protein n=1 Tax=Dehalobacter sp. DCM TaxID=2907827 RepID=UPI003081CC9D|nr:YbaK/EbsC family protein [Dehalobacter sp. DCM]